uniref:Uncharacterized protein n=1 Tax=Rhizophora mucronata TaxID=61149 RepID=A0A2P2PGN5_RHIMU
MPFTSSTIQSNCMPLCVGWYGKRRGEHISQFGVSKVKHELIAQ